MWRFWVTQFRALGTFSVLASLGNPLPLALCAFFPPPRCVSCPSLRCVWCPTAPRQIWRPATKRTVSSGHTATGNSVPTCNWSQCRLKQPWHLDSSHPSRRCEPRCAIIPWRHSETCEYTRLSVILRAVRRRELTWSSEVLWLGLTVSVFSPSLRAFVASSGHPEKRTCIEKASVPNVTWGCCATATKWAWLELTCLGRAASFCWTLHPGLGAASWRLTSSFSLVLGCRWDDLRCVSTKQYYVAVVIDMGFVATSRGGCSF